MRPPSFPPTPPRRKAPTPQPEKHPARGQPPAPLDAPAAGDEQTRAAAPSARTVVSLPGHGSGLASVSTRLRERLEELEGARRRSILKRLGVAVGALLILGAAAWGVFLSPLMALDLDAVQVSGTNEYVSPADTLDVVAPYAGTPLARLNTAGIRKQVIAHYAVRDARIERVWPAGLKITLDSRTPVALIPAKKGYSVLDADGVELGASKKAVDGLPIIHIPPSAADLAETLGAALDVMESLPASLLEQVQTVRAKNPDEVEFTLERGSDVIWGSARDSELKAATLELLLEVPAKTYNVVSPLSPITS